MDEDAVERLYLGVDWAQDNGEETVVIFGRKNTDGTATIIAELRGEAAEYVARLEQALEAQRKENEWLLDALDAAWGLIANVGGGDWSQQNDEWQEAAARFRAEQWHPALDRNAALEEQEAQGEQ